MKTNDTTMITIKANDTIMINMKANDTIMINMKAEIRTAIRVIDGWCLIQPS